MAKHNEFVVMSSGNIRSAEGRLAYVNLFTPTVMKGEADTSKAKYQCSIVFPKGTDVTAIAQAIEAVAVEKFGTNYAKKHKVRKPFLNTEDYPKIGLDPAEFPFFVRVSSKDRPQIVDARMNNVGPDKAEQVYSGRWAFVSLRPFAWEHSTGGKGISLGLQNVQVLRDDEPLGGGRTSADREFEPVEGASGGTDELFDKA